MQLIYYMDVLSSWCYYAEPAIRRVRETFGDRLRYEWRIAWIDGGATVNYKPGQLAWFYRRSGSISGTRLNPVWSKSSDASRWANIAAQAARTLGCTDDRVRLALAKSGMIDGMQVSQREVAAAVAAQAGGLDEKALARAMDDPAVEAQLRAWDAEFTKLGATQRPTVVLRSEIEDFYLLSGNFRYEPLEACARALIADFDGYRAFESANEPLPA